MVRDEDPTGYSGTGEVAEGVEFTDGTAVIRWQGDHRSTVVWSDLASARAVHGHDGRTRFEFLDERGAEVGIPTRGMTTED
jgi:hypothetical protein